MNNSKIALENLEADVSENHKAFLQKQQGEITQLVEVINRVEASEDWQKLKKLLLDGIVENLERQVKSEADRKELNAPELYRLQGQLFWARKYANLKKLSEVLKLQIENLKNQLKHE